VPEAVAENRARVCAMLPAEPKWLTQVHGTQVVEADRTPSDSQADAAFTCAADTVCVVQIADCMPVLFCDREGGSVAIAHAGWRGLSSGVLESTIAAQGLVPSRLLAWLGPAIGPNAFEVGGDVLRAFQADSDGVADTPFKPLREGKWLADLFELARRRLMRAGVTAVFGGELCTYHDRERFFSHRRDGITGRQAAFIWIAR
jgi:polyphenol oxidase